MTDVVEDTTEKNAEEEDDDEGGDVSLSSDIES